MKKFKNGAIVQVLWLPKEMPEGYQSPDMSNIAGNLYQVRKYLGVKEEDLCDYYLLEDLPEDLAFSESDLREVTNEETKRRFILGRLLRFSKEETPNITLGKCVHGGYIVDIRNTNNYELCTNAVAQLKEFDVWGTNTGTHFEINDDSRYSHLFEKALDNLRHMGFQIIDLDPVEV